MAEKFIVYCEDCGKEIEIRSVSIFRTADSSHLGELFSYGYRCECGCAIEIDGVSGDGIPDEMKNRARYYSISGDIKSKIDLERRRLPGKVPGNSAKQLLKINRLSWPKQIRDDIWLVYEISSFGKIYYNNASATYSVVDQKGDSFEFPDIEGVILRMQDPEI
jgi:hypothetical protein